MLDHLYKIDGIIKTAREHCDDTGLPYDIFLWRRKNNTVGGKFLFKLPETLIFFNGLAYSFEMATDLFDLPMKTLRDRWNRGKRGAELLKSVERKDGPQPKELLEFQCRKHLRALIRAHPEEAIAALKRGNAKEPFDEAAAMLNAQRFVDAARENTVGTTGMIWETVA